MNLTKPSTRLAAAVLALSLAAPALWACAPHRTTVVRVGPPAPIVEVRPARPAPGAVWIAGHWRWTGHRYVWVRGHWARRPRPHAVWIAGHWVHRGGGWIWISGRWRL